MSRLFQKVLNFTLVSAVSFSLIGVVGDYARSCNNVTGYCGQTLLIWNEVSNPPDFLVAARVCTIAQLILAGIILIFADENLSYKRIYTLSIITSIIFGAVNLILFWTSIPSIETTFDTLYGSSTGVITIGLSTGFSGVVVIVDVVLLLILNIFN